MALAIKPMSSADYRRVMAVALALETVLSGLLAVVLFSWRVSSGLISAWVPGLVVALAMICGVGLYGVLRGADWGSPMALVAHVAMITAGIVGYVVGPPLFLVVLLLGGVGVWLLLAQQGHKIRTALKGPVLVGVLATGGLAYGIAHFVVIWLFGDSGLSDLFGFVVGYLVTIASIVVVSVMLGRIRRFEPQARQTGLVWMGMAALVWFVVWGGFFVARVLDDQARERASEATAVLSSDFQADLSAALRAWGEAHGVTGLDLVLDVDEWSLDTDGDGSRDEDAPILQTLNDYGWAERGLTIGDPNADLIVNHLEWRPVTAAAGSEIWCIPVVSHADFRTADWEKAVPRQCR